MKRVASDLRTKAACILFQEFSSFFYIVKWSGETVLKVASCMKIKPASVLRYLHAGGEWHKGLMEGEFAVPSGAVENINVVPDKVRAVAALKLHETLTTDSAIAVPDASLPPSQDLLHSQGRKGGRGSGGTVYGMKVKEIAKVLHISVSAVKKRWAQWKKIQSKLIPVKRIKK